MAVLTLTTTAGQDTRIADAFAAVSGWTALLPDGSANPVSKAQNVKAQIIAYVRDVVASYESAIAAETARAAAVAAANSAINPT